MNSSAEQRPNLKDVPTTLNIAVSGCSGVMGREVVRAVLDNPGCSLVGGCASPGSASRGRDLAVQVGRPACGLVVSASPGEAFEGADAVIDFSSAVAVPVWAGAARRANAVLVVATTGLDSAAEQALDRASLEVPVLAAPNLSRGLTLVLSLVRRAAAVLDATYDAEVISMAHRRKRDAPSGTALALARAVANGRGADPGVAPVEGRAGHHGPRGPDSISIASVRAGTAFAENTVLFAGDGERIELAHRITSSTTYARTALTAARWLVGREPRRYGLAEVLGLPPG